ncbi:hypothetical protein QHH11_09925 [Aphanizomenon sp. PH219]|nr:hypothetical protein [Aphanizomenon sp. 202]MDK2459449.1 hypothetical protein [Aphanizomenon sp. PH219]
MSETFKEFLGLIVFAKPSEKREFMVKVLSSYPRNLAKVLNCETPFPIPADWVKGECPHCSLPFAKMAKRQKRD